MKQLEMERKILPFIQFLKLYLYRQKRTIQIYLTVARELDCILKDSHKKRNTTVNITYKREQNTNRSTCVLLWENEKIKLLEILKLLNSDKLVMKFET